MLCTTESWGPDTQQAQGRNAEKCRHSVRRILVLCPVVRGLGVDLRNITFNCCASSWSGQQNDEKQHISEKQTNSTIIFSKNATTLQFSDCTNALTWQLIRRTLFSTTQLKIYVDTTGNTRWFLSRTRTNTRSTLRIRRSAPSRNSQIHSASSC